MLSTLHKKDQDEKEYLIRSISDLYRLSICLITHTDDGVRGLRVHA